MIAGAARRAGGAPLVRRLHLVLGLLAAVPLLAWTTSGLLYALPGAVADSGSVLPIDGARVRVAAPEALARASAFAGRPLPVTALLLTMRDGRPTWEAIGGLGGSSLLVDAESGEVRTTPPPDARTRFFRAAHFWFFAGRAQAALLVVGCVAGSLAALSGLTLAALVIGRRSVRPPPPLRGER